MGWVPLAFGSEWVWLLGGLVPVEVLPLLSLAYAVWIVSCSMVELGMNFRPRLRTRPIQPCPFI